LNSSYPVDRDGNIVEYDHVRPVLARGGAAGLFRAAVYGTVRVEDAAVQNTDTSLGETALSAALGRRSIVLIGMMGAGKSSIGRRLAARLNLPFVDADSEIEKAASMTIPEIFSTQGEAYFRAGETRVIARLLDSGPQVLATGGGAFMNPETRAAIRAKGISVWLNAPLDILMRRIKRRAERPLLAGDDPAATLTRLIAERYPVYAEAEIAVESRDVPHEAIVGEIVAKLCSYPGLVTGNDSRETDGP
jgi:shikimate kinase